MQSSLLKYRIRRLLIALCFLAMWANSLMAAGSGVVKGPLVVSEKWPECTSLQTWMRDILRLEGVESASETAQAKVFFRWLRLFSKMATGGMLQAHEGEYGKEQYVMDAHKNLFVYGWGYCDTHSRIAQAAWSEFKKDAKAAERVITQHADGGYHTMYRLRLDGQYGAFDARYGYYLIDHDAPDARILDWAEVGIDENILKNRSYAWRCGPFFEYFGKEWERALLLQPRYYDSEDAWIEAGRPVECVFGNSQYEMGTQFHDMSFWLPKGTTLERHWDNSARKFYVPAGFESKGEEPFLPSGRFYRITETMLNGNWVKFDPNYKLCAPYLTTVPSNEWYNADVRGGRTIGQAWGRMIYEPNFASSDFLEVSAVSTDLIHRTDAPYLRPSEKESGGQVTFDFYSPYVLVDGVLSGEWSAAAEDAPKIEMRVLLPKPKAESEPDRWSGWQTVHSETGAFRCELGRPRFKAREISLHGVYHFQLRFSISSNPGRKGTVGLKSMKLESYFENGIMSLPRIVAGRNAVHFKVADTGGIHSPIKVVYRYQTASGEKAHEQILRPGDFRDNVATYQFDAPGLTRCNSLVIAY